MLKVREAVAEDRPEILALIERVFGADVATRARRFWAWQWEADPRLAGRGYQGVVIEWDGQMIATMATIPAGLFLRGHPVNAFWYVDALVHWSGVRRALRAARASGCPDQLALFSKGISQLIFTAPELSAYQLGKHLTPPMQLAAHEAGAIDQPGTQSLDRVVSVKALLGRSLGRALGWMLGTIVDLFLPSIARQRHEVRLLEGDFDARFDVLWTAALKSHVAITLRDARLLNWRYRQHPERSYEVLIIEAGDALLGYLVMGRIERHGQARAQIVDLLAHEDDPRVLNSLVVAALRRLRRDGVLKLECYTGSAAVRDVLIRLRFRERRVDGKSMPVVIRPDPGLPELYVTRGDGDGG